MGLEDHLVVEQDGQAGGVGAIRSDSTAENSRASRSLDALLVSTDVAGDAVLAVPAD